MRRTAAWVLLALVLGTASLVGDLIGVGLDWRKNIFVQEYWQDGKLFYAIANHNDADAEITVSSRQTKEKLAAPWKVAGHSAIHVDVTLLEGKDLIAFSLRDGTLLGLLESPQAPPAEAKGTVVSTYGLNGSGGRDAKGWVETAAMSVKAESTVEMTLMIPGDAGELVVSRAKNRGVKVTCETLKVVETKDNFTLDFSKPVKKEALHTVVLSLTAPEVEKPTMMVIDTWLWQRSRKGGHGITRGIVVLPKERKEKEDL